MTRTTTDVQYTTTPIVAQSRLFLALDVSSTSWACGFTDGGPKVRLRSVDRKDVAQARIALRAEIALALEVFGLTPETPVVACYEAGRDGFWIARWLELVGVACVVVDPSSIEVSRRAKHAKTDAIDATKLALLLVRHQRGEAVMRTVAVPSAADEDARELDRTIYRLQGKRQQMTSTIESLLFKHGIDRQLDSLLLVELDLLRTGDGAPLGSNLRQQIRLLAADVALLEAQLDELQQQRARAIAEPHTKAEKIAHDLDAMTGVGPVGAWVLAQELFGTRTFASPKKVGAFLGLTPTPWASGKMAQDQGISKAGPGRVRALMIQLAWAWLRYQPESALAKWYQERFGATAKRSRRVGIVALARKLAVALWRYAVKGVVPDGATMKPEASRTRPRTRARRAYTRKSTMAQVA